MSFRELNQMLMHKDLSDLPKDTGKKLDSLFATIPTGSFELSFEENQRFAFWLAKAVSKHCPDRDTLDPSWHTRGKQFREHAIQTHRHCAVVPQLCFALSSRAKHDSPSFFYYTSLLVAFLHAERLTEQCTPRSSYEPQNRMSSAPLQTVFSVSISFHSPSPTLQSLHSASLAALFFEPFGTTRFSPGIAPSSQQNPETSVSNFSPQTR